ncbi:MAG: flagellar export protein FliJ [Thermodesulfobacteriota bacterium]|nr:flagellar export protein FliJ [Thermodesulfobacteriota bacterium]
MMVKSRFDAIITHREWIEDGLKRELADIKLSLEEERKRLASWNQLGRDSLKTLQEKQEKGTTISEVLLYYSFLNGLSTEIKKQEVKIERTRVQFDQKLDELVEASREKKIVMKIKEKELERIRLQVLKKEQKFVDEMGISKYNRERVR